MERPGGIVRDQTRLEVEFHALITQRPFKFGIRFGLSLFLPDRPGRDDGPEILEFRLRIAFAQARLEHVGEHPGVVEHIPKRQLRAGRGVEIIGFVFPVRLVRSVVSLFLEQQAEAVFIRARDGLGDLPGIERVAQRQFIEIFRQIHGLVVELRAEAVERIGQRGPVSAVHADARIVDIALHALVEHAVIAVRLIREREAADGRFLRGFRCIRFRRLFRRVGLRRFIGLDGFHRLGGNGRFVRGAGGFCILAGGKRQHHRKHKQACKNSAHNVSFPEGVGGRSWGQYSGKPEKMQPPRRSGLAPPSGGAGAQRLRGACRG